MGIHDLQKSRRGIALAIALALGTSLAVTAQASTDFDANGVASAAAPQAESSDQATPQAANGSTGLQSTAPTTDVKRRPTDLGVVIVTANKRSERLQDVPMAVSALSGYDLERINAVSFSDYITRFPGLNVISGSQGHTQLVMRGITSGSNQTNATVGTYIDDAPYGSSTIYAAGSVLTPDIDPADLLRVEVLSGPQGTLYGSNTLGGLVKFVTTPPDSTSAYGRLGLGVSAVDGGGSGTSARGMFNLPLVANVLALRANVYSRTDPGYIDNVNTGKTEVNEARVRGGRAQLLWTPTDKASVRLSALAQNLSSDGLANGGVDVDPATLKPTYGDLKQWRAAETGMLNLKYRLYDASVNADFGWAKLVFSTSYGTLRDNENVDVTALFGPLLAPLLGIPNAGFSLRQPIASNKFTQELRLESPSTDTLEWRAGIFYTREHSTNGLTVLSFDATTGVPISGLPVLADGVEGPASFTEWAGYADVTYHVTSRFSMLVGARYTHDQTQYSQSGTGLLVGDSAFTTHGSDSPTTYLINPSYKFSDDLMLYARVASGFRPGGPNVGVPPGLGAPITFKPDHLVSYELGLKTTLLDKRMTLNVDAYYINWNQVQLAVATGGFNYLGNGGKATSQGVEASWQFAPVGGLLLSANATWSDAVLATDTPPGLFGYKGDRLPYVPKWNANVGIDYDFPLAGGWSGFVGSSYRYVGERQSDFNAEPVPRLNLPGYSSLDFRAGASFDHWAFEAYIKNATNKRGITALGAETADLTASPYAAGYTPPRTVGISATVDF